MLPPQEVLAWVGERVGQDCVLCYRLSDGWHLYEPGKDPEEEPRRWGILFEDAGRLTILPIPNHD